MRIAVYAGTFDPVTAGHLSVIERADKLFDSTIVLVAVNPTKTPLFAVDERLLMIREATEHLQHVECAATEGWVVDYARAHGAAFLVRGIRGVTDADYETALAQMNRAVAPEITTVFLPAHSELSQVSSTLLKEMARLGEEIRSYCPVGVERRLREKLGAMGKDVRHACTL
jgi:pantetheine-phosphate adenylyltransferase